MAAVPTRVLSFDVNESDATPIEGAICTARLNVADIYQEEVVDRVLESTLTDVNGQAALNLFPNVLGERNTVYVVTIRHPTTNRAILKTVIRMPDSDVNLADIVGNAVPDVEFPSAPGINQIVGPGFIVKQADANYVTRTFNGTVNQVNVANGNGEDGNVTLSLPQDIHAGASPSFANLTVAGTIAAAILAITTSLSVPSLSVGTGLNLAGMPFGEAAWQVKIRGSAIFQDGLLAVWEDDTAGTPAIGGFKSRDAGAAVQTGDYLLTVGGSGFGVLGFYWQGSSIAFRATESFTDTTAGSNVSFWTTPNGSITQAERWRVEHSGHLLAGSDNALDIGASGATRPRSLYWGTQALAPSAVVGYSFADATGHGFSYLPASSGNHFAASVSGTTVASFSGSAASNGLGIVLRNTASLRWSADGNVFEGASSDVFLLRDAANTLAQRNGAAAQTVRVYNTFTDASNYERGIASWVGNNFIIGTEVLGTGVPRKLQFASSGVSWELDSGGTFSPDAPHNNAADLGALGRLIRTGYFGTSVFTPVVDTPAATNLSLQAAGVNARWTITFADGALQPSSNDNAQNLGSPGGRVKTGYFGTGVIIGAGGGSSRLDLYDNTPGANWVRLRGNVGATNPPIGSGGLFTGWNFSNGDGETHLLFGTAEGGAPRLSFGSWNGTVIAEQFRVEHAASAVNYVAVQGASTGNPVFVLARGSDTNVALNVGSQGAGSIVFSTNATAQTQFVIAHVASAVNYLQAAGRETGNGPILSAQGTDTNVNLELRSKGTGSVVISTGSGVGVIVANAPSAVNYMTLTGSATGNGVAISAEGTDTNVGVLVSSKGTGSVSIQSGNTARTIAQFVNVASSVNFVQVAGSATGNTVTLSAQGSDTNVDLTLTPKGTGVLRGTGAVAVVLAGKNAVPIPAHALTPRLTNGCGSLAFTTGAAGQPDVPYLPFDGAAKEFAWFLMRMPKGWNEGTITAAFSWRRASGTGAADVVWGIRALAISDNETPVANFGSDATVTDAASTTTANMNVSGETGACTIGGTPAEGDLVFFEVFRDGAAGGDTLNAVDAWLTEVTLFITTNAPNDA
jgi:phosphotransferase system HPr-like phosphotransfer protein